MNIIHISTIRNLSAGVRKQLEYEHEAAKTLQGANWETVVFHDSAPINPFEKRLPFGCRNLFMARLYTWLYLINHQKNYDIIVQRYLPFDPFSILFGWFLKNRITIHHGKEIEELRLIRKGFSGFAASNMEKVVGKLLPWQVAGTIGVTGDIVRYEMHNGRSGALTKIYPNGINLEKTEPLHDEREDVVNAAFVCGTFSSWHGLDRLLEAIRSDPQNPRQTELKIHLIGKLSESDLGEIRKINSRSDIFEVHGVLSGAAYRRVLAKCDYGIGSLAMDRENLEEGCTLKVREYLALGLPVYSGHDDAAIPKSFPYYERANLSVDHLLEFGYESKKTSRDAVRNESMEFIDKKNLMERLVDWLNKNINTALHPKSG